MSADTVRKALESQLESSVEVGTYRGVEGVWAKVELDPRIDNSMRPTSLACEGTVVEEMKVRFVATTAPRATVVETLSELESLTPAAGEVSAENHDLAEGEELWPHIRYEHLALSEAAKCLATIEAEPLPV
ncbi:MAG: hypothetical protein V5A24_03005, partial [Haloarculaceae archaeon]